MEFILIYCRTHVTDCVLTYKSISFVFIVSIPLLKLPMCPCMLSIWCLWWTYLDKHINCTCFKFSVRWIIYLCFIRNVFQGFHLVLYLKPVVLSLSFVELSLFVAMKLGEAVTYSGFDGISFCASVSVHFAGAQWLWWESWIWNHLGPPLPCCLGGNLLGLNWSATAAAMCKLELFLDWMVVTALLGLSQCPRW